MNTADDAGRNEIRPAGHECAPGNALPAGSGPLAKQPSNPPPLPPANKAGSEERRREGSTPCARLAEDFGPMDQPVSGLRVAEMLLKRPGRVVYEVTKNRQTRVDVALLGITIICMAGFGLIMGAFSGGDQLWAVPVKVTAGILVSVLICLPSLYIFTCLTGSDQSISEVWGLLLSCAALVGILLAGFAPIAWIFSQSTSAVGFMGFLYLVFWFVALHFGLRLLKAALVFMGGREPGVIRLWGFIFLLVLLQMSTTLRPLVGEYKGFRLLEKKFFLEHWTQCVD